MKSSLNRDEVNELIRDLVKQEGTQTAAAAKLGIVSSYMSDLLKGKRDPGPEVLKFFGLEKKIIYISK